MEINVDSHFSLTSNDDIKKLAINFFNKKRIEINHLNFIHRTYNGYVYYLCSNHHWLKHYLTSEYTHIGAFESNPALVKNRYVLWDSLDSDDIILKDSTKLINVTHGITVIDHTKTGHGFFNFGNDYGGLSTLNNYVNNLGVFNEFILYFYSVADHLIKQASQQSILIQPVNKFGCSLKNGFCDNTNQPNFSQREMHCIHWYLQGKNSGEIAIILGISRRTVETHIENIKIKLGCSTLFQVGYRLAQIQYQPFVFDQQSVIYA